MSIVLMSSFLSLLSLCLLARLCAELSFAGPLPPRQPASAGFISFPFGEVEMIAEVFAGEVAQLFGGRKPYFRLLVGEPFHEPFDAIETLVALPPPPPPPAAVA